MAADVDDAATIAAKKAAGDYTRRGVVYVVARGSGGKIEWHGSGTLWRAANGRSVVLTAAHVIENHRSFTIGSPLGLQLRIHNAIITEHSSLDLALIHLPEHEISMLAFDASALSDATSVSKGAPLVVAGFPKYISFTERDEVGEIFRLADVTSYSIAAGSDASTLSIEWIQTEISEETARAFAPVGAKAGVQGLKKPSGLSGGAAWLWDNGDGSLLWVPSVRLKLVGVPNEYKNQRELAVPVWKFRDWLLAALA